MKPLKRFSVGVEAGLLYFVASVLLAIGLTLGDYDTYGRDLMLVILNLPGAMLVESRVLGKFITDDPLLPYVVMGTVDALIGGLLAVIPWSMKLPSMKRHGDKTTNQ